MIVDQFLSWAQHAPLASRADGVSALARAVLYSGLDATQTQAAVVALAGFLDDPALEVRRALADALASASEAPRAVVLALAEDDPSIATIVLSRSPVLHESDLAACARQAPSPCQAAIASRPGLSAKIASILAETGSAEALIILASNLDAALPVSAIAQMIERHGGDARLREALLARGNLPVALHFELVAAAARDAAVAIEVQGRNDAARIERAGREAFEKAAVSVAAGSECTADPGALAALAAHLRQSGRLTPAFACRVLLSGNLAFFHVILSELSAMPLPRVQGFAHACRSTGFAALYRKAGFPAPLLPAFRLMLDTVRDWDLGAHGAMVYPLVMDVHDQCAAINTGALDDLLVMLRRFEGEAARAEAARPKFVALAAPQDHVEIGGLEPHGWPDTGITVFDAGHDAAAPPGCDAAIEIFAAGLQDQFKPAQTPALGANAPQVETPGAVSSRVDHEDPEVLPFVRKPNGTDGAYSAFPFRLAMQTEGDKQNGRVPLIDVESSMADFEAELFAA